MRRILGLCSVCSIWGAMLLGMSAMADPGTARGSLSIGEATIEFTGAVARESISKGFSQEEVIRVYLSPSTISTDGLETALDPEQTLRDSLVGDYAIVTLSRQGRLQNLYVFFEDGSQNFGLGGMGRADIESIAERRIKGRVLTTQPETIGKKAVTFDVSFASALQPRRTAKAVLKPGGGAPGEAYRAYLQAVTEADREALLELSHPQQAAELRSTPNEMWAYVAGSLQDLAPRGVRVLGGEVFEGFALLEIEGVDAYDDKIEGKVQMLLVDGRWRFGEEDLEPAW